MTICGLAGTSKSTLGKRMAKYAGTEFVSVGGFQRQTAKRLGIPFKEFLKLLEKDPSYDHEVDTTVRRYAAKHPSFVIEGRLAYRFAHGAFNLLLTCHTKVAAKRIAGREKMTVSKAHAATVARNRGDRRRFKKVYGIVGFDDRAHFHAVIDTTNKTPLQVLDLAFEKFHQFMSGRA
jgi:cytidylate kinase